MAWARGTATDFIDFLRKFRDYSAGLIDPSTDPDITEGVVVPSGDQWEILVNGAGQPDIPGSGFATDGEVYLKGPGMIFRGNPRKYLTEIQVPVEA